MLNNTYKIRPYARLITMLGEQLIKNEVIALSELIKNSYDADADWVKVSFCNFNEDYSINDDSKIIILDNGIGMNQKIIETSWLNPATPSKLKQKRETNNTPKGRILQGEKGIGRFAVFKLGSTIKITTKTDEDKYENILTYDFSIYDNDFLRENNVEKELYLDELNVEYRQEQVKNFTKENLISYGVGNMPMDKHGTIIEISNLKTSWSESKIKNLQTEIAKMLPIFQPNGKPDFIVEFYFNNERTSCNDKYIKDLLGLLENKPVFKIKEGHYNEKKQEISFKINDTQKILSFNDPDFKGISYFNKYLSKDKKTCCGDFDFEFYMFDLNADKDTKYYLSSKDEKQVIKQHRVYLYRDGIRVLPYGDVEDDWLSIDILRGTTRAAEFLSNDQVIGCVYITNKENDKLKDKTNREGLIDDSYAFREFVSILQCFLRYVRANDYAKYLANKERVKEEKLIKEGRPEAFFQKLQEQFKDDDKAIKTINECSNAYKKEKQILIRRIEQVEDLAAVGLSVETASHDIMMILNLVYEKLSNLYNGMQRGSNIDRGLLENELAKIITNVNFIKDAMKDIQILFPSTKYKAKIVNVGNILNKVYNMYKKSLDENKVNVNIYSSSKNLLQVKARDAVLFQTFINLFDNAIYWLKTVDNAKKIEIEIDTNSQRLIFSDSGPGIRDDIKSYIFEPFFSGKGEDGRGLGLYIARQLLDRYGFSIDLASLKSDKHLSGANFVIDFSKKGIM